MSFIELKIRNGIKMLKKILNPKSCAACRVCCGFDREDVWEVPLISHELADYIKKNINADIALEPVGDEYRFKMNFKDGEELSYCPMLTDTGCILKDSKPFDCRIWPFRVMKISDGIIGITVSPVCEAVSALSVSKLTEFITGGEGIAEVIFDYAKAHPDIVKEYIENYPILSIRKI